jgi:crotonobetainyl-CoA:carnitine CoA-transferase CaiB-like acyl-CoA transferase
MSGLMRLSGEPDGEPTKTGTMICDVTAGMYAVTAILAALRHREMQGGGGQHIDLALLDTSIAALTTQAQSYLCTGASPGRFGAATPGNQPSGTYRCADGMILITAGADHQFRSLARALELEKIVDDPRFLTRPLRAENREQLTELLEARFRGEPRAYWLERLLANDVMAAPINSVADAFADPQVQHREMTTTTQHRRAGALPLVSNPIHFSKTPIGAFSPPPDVGEHTDAVLKELLGVSDDDLARWSAEGVI